MICKMCATGADMQSRASEMKVQGEVHDALIFYGKRLHNECTDCDCQHKSQGSTTAST